MKRLTGGILTVYEAEMNGIEMGSGRGGGG